MSIHFRLREAGDDLLRHGANQGFYSILLSKLAGKTGKVFSFEPVKKELRKMKLNLNLNFCRNVIVENKAVSCQDGIGEIFVCLDGHASRSSLAPPPQEVKARTTIEKIPLISLDSYVKENNIKRVDLIKIDVEGGERDILKGGELTIKCFQPVIMIELADVAAAQHGYHARESYLILQSYNYTLFEVLVNGCLKEAKLKESYGENLIAIPTHRVGDFRGVILHDSFSNEGA
jgi:FkbM family methyltransferase